MPEYGFYSIIYDSDSQTFHTEYLLSQYLTRQASIKIKSGLYWAFFQGTSNQE